MKKRLYDSQTKENFCTAINHDDGRGCLRDGDEL